MNKEIVFESDRICFCKWSKEDFEDFKNIATNPKVMKYIGTGELWSDERILGFIEGSMELFNRLNFCLWPIYRKPEKEFIGFCGLTLLNEPDEIEIGWWLHPSYWGMGIATEAASRVVTYAFNELKLSQIVSIAQPENSSSINIMKKIGMKFKKMTKSHHGIDIVYYVLKNDNGTENIEL